jgi:ATP-dependent Lhr-like helicase
VSLDKTSLVQKPSGEVHWWTFGGGVANTLCLQHLVPGQNARADNMCLRFPTSMKLAEAETLIDTRLTEEIRPTPDEAAIENLKFSECLPSHVAGEVFSARFNDPKAIATIRKEPRRVVVG